MVVIAGFPLSGTPRATQDVIVIVIVVVVVPPYNWFLNKMTITLLIMYLFKIRQMQKIEQVMPDLSVILPAPRNLLCNFLKRDLLSKRIRKMINCI